MRNLRNEKAKKYSGFAVVIQATDMAAAVVGHIGYFELVIQLIMKYLNKCVYLLINNY